MQNNYNVNTNCMINEDNAKDTSVVGGKREKIIGLLEAKPPVLNPGGV